jgi:hypothetical protein
MANYWRKRTYQTGATDPSGLSKRGLVYLMSEFFTVGANASVYFALDNNVKEVEFQYYDITSAQSEIHATLIEAPETVTRYNYITPRNVNRKFPDNATASLSAASAVTGGTPIASELVGSTTKAGGEMSSQKIHTLRDGVVYVMRFVNVSNQATTCHMNLGWSENDPEPYRLVDPVDPTD